MCKSVIGIDAMTEPSQEHIQKVCQLTIEDIMELDNKGLIPHDLLDDLYYYLLDKETIRKELK